MSKSRKMRAKQRGPASPFPLPARLDPQPARVQSYWSKLRRGQAEIPFADDVKLGALGKAAAGVMFLDVLQGPVRFRFAIVGGKIEGLYGQSLAGMFADEITPQSPFDYLVAQCSTTIESRGSTYFHRPAYSRLLLPLWGDGHINGLLGAIFPIKARPRRRRR